MRQILYWPYYGRVVECVVIRETPAYRYLENAPEGHWSKKIRKRVSMFGTWEEARDELVRRAEDEVHACKEDLQRARSKLGSIKSLKKPKGK